MKFDPVAICTILNQEGVEYIVLGGFAAVIHGSPLPTEDIDVLPSRTQLNLENLARALRTMNAKIRTSGDPVEAPMDSAFLENMTTMLNLVTDHGILDLTFQPAGPTVGFEQWDANASSEEISEGLVIRVASLNNIISSKEAAGREKDIGALPYLRALRDQS
jgi:hypothetical protein